LISIQRATQCLDLVKPTSASMGSMISSTICNLVGAAYPAYATFKALESEEKADDIQWYALRTCWSALISDNPGIRMSYWIIFAIFICVEEVADTFIGWFPFYYTAKIVALILLQWPKLNVSACRPSYLLKLFLVGFDSLHAIRSSVLA
jgi:receptor expression-enhancing protein 5/6